MAGLTQREARERAARVRVSYYEVEFDLDVGDDEFRSVTTVEFESDRPGESTFLEVRPRVLRSVVFNGRPLDVGTLADGRLPLPGLLTANTVIVVADMAYSNEGQGLHRFVDPADGETYLYGHCAVDAAPLMRH
jgi:aminopeptidase N